MGMHVTDKELQKLIKSIGYKGCKNCEHQISPLRMCRWAEQGGDSQIHIICPKWNKAESEDKCKNCEYYHNPDYTRCHECETERSEE